MLAVFFGSDQSKVRSEAHKYIEGVIKDGQLLARIEADVYESGQILSLLSSVALFGVGAVYLMDTLSDDKIAYDELIAQLESLASSVDTFVVIERDLKISEQKKFSKHTSSINEFKKVKEDKFNSFALADALLNKDRKQLWILLQEAKMNNLSAEEMVGILWWQLKTLRMAGLTTSADEAGVKDYPYNKSKRALRNFKEGELENLSFKLLQLYHDGHAGKRDINLALEEWVLRG